MTEEERTYYDNCHSIYKELTGTKLLEYLVTLRDKSIHRIATSKSNEELWGNVGELRIIDNLTKKGRVSFNEIKRIDALNKEE